MSPTVVVVRHQDGKAKRVERRLTRRGIQVETWLGFADAHSFISRRRPDLVLICAHRADHEAARRLIEEITWDPHTRSIPVMLETEPSRAQAEPVLNEVVENVVAILAASSVKSSTTHVASDRTFDESSAGSDEHLRASDEDRVSHDLATPQDLSSR